MLYVLAWRNLWRNKRRTVITAGSVFFAVLLAIVTQSIQTGVYDIMIRNMVGYYTGYIQFHQKGYWTDQSLDNSFEVSKDFIRTIKSNKEVLSVASRIETFALVSGESITKGTLIVGTDPDEENKLTSLADKVTKGTYFGADDHEVMLAEGLAEDLKLKVGDTLVIIGQGYQGQSAANQYRIKALVKFGSPELNRRLVYLPLKTSAELFSMEGMVTSLALGLKNPDKTNAVVSELVAKTDTSLYEVMGWEQLTPELKQGIEADYISSFFMLGVLYVIICFGIFGTILMMLSERRREFGVMIAIGMKKTRLAFMVIIELVNIALIGVVTGMLAAIPVVWYLYYRPIPLTGKAAEGYISYGFEPVIQAAVKPGIFVNHALIVLAITCILALFPLYKIGKTNAVEAMRS